MSSIVLAVEKLETAREAIETLLAAQWEETGDSEFVCRPNWPFYAKLEEIGAGYVMVMREDGIPIGWLAAMIHPHVNATDVKVGTVSSYYVKPRSTRAVLLKSLYRAVLRDLAVRGCWQVSIETEFGHSAGRLLELLGGRPKKIGYSFDLQEAKHA